MDNFNIKKFLIENKLTRLSEQDDEWDFEAGDEWNVTELTVGDAITPNMWKNENERNQLSNYYFISDNWFNFNQKYKIEEIFEYDVQFDFDSSNIGVRLVDEKGNEGINPYESDLGIELFEYEYVTYLNEINDLLKPQYQIVPSLNESEDDDWDLEADEEWNIKDLTAGDYITQEMFDDSVFTKSWRQLNQDIKIVGFKKNPLIGDVFTVEYLSSSGKPRRDDISVETFNEHFLKPGYRIVAP